MYNGSNKGIRKHNEPHDGTTWREGYDGDPWSDGGGMIYYYVSHIK